MTIRPYRIVLLSLLFLQSFWLIAQSKKIDVLMQRLDRLGEDTTKVNVALELAFEYWNFDEGIALFYSQQALSLSDELDYTYGKAAAYTNIGLYHSVTGDQDQAKQYYQKSLAALDGQVIGKYPSYTLSRLGNIARMRNQYDSALIYYAQARETASDDSMLTTSSIYYNMGIAYLKMEKYDSAKANVMRSLALRKEWGDSLHVALSIAEMASVHIVSGQMDSAQYYLTELSHYSANTNYPEIDIHYFINQGFFEYLSGNYANAIQSIRSSLVLLNDFEYIQLEIRCNYILGMIYSEIGEYDGAIENLLEAKMLNEPIQDSKQDADIDYNLSYIYQEQGNLESAKEFALSARDLYTQLGLPASEAAIDNLLGLIELEKKNYDASIYFFERGLATHKEQSDKRGIATILYNQSYVFLELGDTAKVLDMQLEALDIEKQIGNTTGMIISYNNLGDLYFAIKDYSKAEENLLNARALLQQYPAISNLEENNRFLARVYYSTSQYKKAYDYLLEAKQNSDSVFSQNSLERSLQLSSIYDLREKEREIENLNEEREAKEKELLLQEQQLQLQRALLILGALAIAFFAVLSYFLVRTIKKLRQTQKELIKAEKRASVGTLITGLSHEINNPLNFIKGGVETLRYSQKKWSEDQLKMLDAIDQGTERSARILSALAQFSKQQQSEEKPCRINALILNALEDLEEFKSDSVEFIIEQDPSSPKVLGIAVALQRLFYELIKNAIHATAGRGTIRIAVTSSRKECFVQIIDDGVGIQDKDLNFLENPFYTTKEPNEGVGLGLYIVDHIVSNHGGTFKFESSGANGTSVSLTFPKAS